MDQQELITRVNSVMQEGFELKPEQIKPTARLKEDLELDSLDAIDMLVFIEDELKIRVDVEQFKETKTLQDIYDTIFAMTKDSKIDH